MLLWWCVLWTLRQMLTVGDCSALLIFEYVVFCDIQQDFCWKCGKCMTKRKWCDNIFELQLDIATSSKSWFTVPIISKPSEFWLWSLCTLNKATRQSNVSRCNHIYIFTRATVHRILSTTIITLISRILCTRPETLRELSESWPHCGGQQYHQNCQWKKSTYNTPIPFSRGKENNCSIPKMHSQEEWFVSVP